MKSVFKRKLERRDFALIISVLLWVVLLGFVSGIYFKVNTESRRTFRQAKDVLIAMKLIAIEKYGTGDVYSSADKRGITDTTEAQIHRLSKTKGEITLISWDSIYNEPVSFTYKNGNYTVYYERQESGYGEWTVRYSIGVMHFEHDEEDEEDEE